MLMCWLSAAYLAILFLWHRRGNALPLVFSGIYSTCIFSEFSVINSHLQCCCYIGEVCNASTVDKYLTCGL